jgi:hypothetical protein
MTCAFVLDRDEKVVWTMCKFSEELEPVEYAGGSDNPGRMGTRVGTKKGKTTTSYLGASGSDRCVQGSEIQSCNGVVRNLECRTMECELDPL